MGLETGVKTNLTILTIFEENPKNGIAKDPSSSGLSARRTPPGANEPQQKEFNGKWLEWCETCKRWSPTHNSETHRRGVGRNGANHQDTSNENGGPQASLLFDTGAWGFCCEVGHGFVDGSSFTPP